MDDDFYDSDCSNMSYVEAEADKNEDYLDDDSLDLTKAVATKEEIPEFQYSVLTPEEIQQKMFQVVDEVKSVVQMPRPIVRALLSHFGWDRDELMSQYFSASDQKKLFTDAHLVYPQTLESNHPNISTSEKHDVDCVICDDTFESKSVTGLDCGHLFCLTCWEAYLTQKIQSEGKAEAIYCPATECNIVASEETILLLLKDKAVKIKYRYLITNSFVQASRTLTWCPKPGCTNAVFAMDREGHSVQCTCSGKFCFKCAQEPHEPLTCDMFRKWNMKFANDGETSRWLGANTKGCLRCHTPIEKNQGCNHMTCTVSSCRYEFCWICLGRWEDHKNSYFQCNRYNERESVEAREEQKKSRAELERYLFYCNRFLDHHNSVKMEAKLYNSMKVVAEELQKLGIPLVETEFLHSAVTKLIQCRNVLKLTYAFAYYLKKNNECLIFERNQADLQNAVEALSEKLESEFTRSKGDFSKVRKEILNKAEYCKSRMKVLMEHISDGYTYGTWEFLN